MLDLSGKVAVITGAGSGIGRGIALALARAGADIAASDIDLESARETAELVRALGRQALAERVDVRDGDALRMLANSTVRKLGRLDICVANAGIGRFGSVLTLPLEEWQAVVDINLTGVFLTVQACGREMVRLGNGGRVLVMSSLAAEVASPRWAAYNATKAAVRHATRSWAFDLAPFGITVNAIGPGWVDTPLLDQIPGRSGDRADFAQMVPLGRVADAERDIGALAVWLASDAASYVTGGYHVIDGGLHDGGAASVAAVALRELAAQHRGDDLLAALEQREAELRGQSA